MTKTLDKHKAILIDQKLLQCTKSIRESANNLREFIESVEPNDPIWKMHYHQIMSSYYEVSAQREKMKQEYLIV